MFPFLRAWLYWVPALTMEHGQAGGRLGTWPAAAVRLLVSSGEQQAEYLQFGMKTFWLGTPHRFAVILFWESVLFFQHLKTLWLHIYIKLTILTIFKDIVQQH